MSKGLDIGTSFIISASGDKEVTYNDLPVEVQQAVNFSLRKMKHEIFVDDD